ncbi:hypothetical protein BH11ARM2_BH11ARM2_15660 [soil metagenome]
MTHRGAILTGGATVALVVLAIGTASRYFGSDRRAALLAQYERARTLGLPGEMADLWPAPKSPSANAAPLYTALGTGHGLREAREETDKVGYPTTPAQARALRKALLPYDGSLRDFERLAALPECRFVRTPSLTVLLPEYATLKSGVAALAGRARLEAAEGDPMKAMGTLDAAARTSGHAGVESIFVAKLVAVATQAITLRAAQEILGDYGKRAHVRAAARKVLADLGPLPSVKDGMKGEWAFQKGTMEGLANGTVKLDGMLDMSASPGVSTPVSGPRLTLATLSLRTPGGLAEQSAFTARAFLNYYEALSEDPANLTEARGAYAALLHEIEDGGGLAVLASAMTVQLGGISEAAARAVVERRAFKGLLNALDDPTPPKSLPLTGPEGIDPFSGELLLYRAGPEGIRVWSVGPNGKDDGGLPKHLEGVDDIAAIWPYAKSVPKAEL